MPVVSAPSAPAAPSDDALLDRFAGGDRTALDELFRRYRGVAFRVAHRLLGREPDALDAVQDGFVKVLLNLDRFRGRSSFKTWLLRIVSNAAMDVGRQRRRDRFSHDAAADAVPPARVVEGAADAELDRADLRRAIDAALAQLPAAQRQTFVLHVDGEMSYKEVAEALGISIGTVMSRLFYARRKLKTLLADRVSP